MPRSAKLVIGFLIVLLFADIFSICRQTALSQAKIFAVVVHVSLLIGLSKRQRMAWYVARWFSVFAIFSNLIILLFLSLVEGEGRLEFALLVTIWLISSLILFCLLGQHNARIYFNATKV